MNRETIAQMSETAWLLSMVIAAITMFAMLALVIGLIVLFSMTFAIAVSLAVSVSVDFGSKTMVSIWSKVSTYDFSIANIRRQSISDTGWFTSILAVTTGWFTSIILETGRICVQWVIVMIIFILVLFILLITAEKEKPTHNGLGKCTHEAIPIRDKSRCGSCHVKEEEKEGVSNDK